MAKQKRLNTGLVGFLTAIGMIVVVSVVTLIVWQGTRRDPSVLERNAQQLEKAGDLNKAAQFYHRAFLASEEKEPRYLLEAARCWMDLGEIANWHQLIQHVHTKDPKSPVWLNALLEGFMGLQELSGRGLGENLEQLRRDYAQTFVEIDPDNVLALVSQARALWALGAEQDQPIADAALTKAVQLAPHDPRVALAQVTKLERDTQNALRAAQLRSAPRTELEQISTRAATQRLETIAAAVAEHPDHVALVARYARLLEDQARRAAAAGDLPTCDQALATSQTALDEALATVPNSGELHLARAEQLRAQLATHFETLKPEQKTELLQQLDEHARAASAAEKALYDAYIIRADTAQLAAETSDRPDSEGFENALKIYEQATQDTVMLWQNNLRAKLSEVDRLRMLRMALLTALNYYRNTTAADQQAPIFARAAAFVEDAQTKYPEQPLTSYMQGELAEARGDRVGAIQAFETAQARVASLPVARGVYWASVSRALDLPSQHLALLYLQQGELGAAETSARESLQAHETEMNAPAPADAVGNLAEILTRLDRLPEAVELLERYQPIYPNDQRLATALAVVHARSGRTEQADQKIEELEKGDVASQYRRVQILLAEQNFDAADAALAKLLENPELTAAQRDLTMQAAVEARLQRARKAAGGKDYATAVTVLQQAVQDTRATDAQVREALSLYVAVATEGQQQAAGQAFLEGLVRQPPRPNMDRILRQHVLFLSEPDPAKRDEQLRALIAENADPKAQSQEYYSYYVAREQFAEALEHLLKLRQIDPDNVLYADYEFQLRLVLKQFDAAANLLPVLAQYDEGRGLDRAGGATYRAQLALARDDREGAPVAIREYQNALRQLPQNAALEVELARACLVAGRVTDGVEALERAVRINPRNFEAYRLLLLACESRATQATRAEDRANFEAKAGQYLAEARKLNPTHPDVVSADQRRQEREHPLDAITPAHQTWTQRPEDLQNTLRLGELYARVARQLAGSADSSARAKLDEAAAFFLAAIDKLTGTERLSLARSASQFFADAALQSAGEQLLRKVVDAESGATKVRAQLLLAGFLGTVGSIDAAEHAYQEAQVMVAQVIADPAERPQYETQVGQALIDFYKTNDLTPQVIETCRWLLDRLPADYTGRSSVQLQLIESLLATNALKDAEQEIARYAKEGGEAVNAGMLMARAQLNLLKNDRRAAEEDLNALLKSDPQQPWARFTRGNLYLQRGHYDAALADLQVARELIRVPRLQFQVLDRLAQLYTRTAQYDLAEKSYRDQLQVVQQGGAVVDRQTVVSRLARLLYGRARQFDRAQQVISEYMEKFPDEATWPYELGYLFESRATDLRAEAARATQQGDARKADELQRQARESCIAAAPYYRRASEKAAGGDSRPLETALTAQVRALTLGGQPREALAVFQSWPLRQVSPGARVEAAKALMDVNEAAAASKQWEQAVLDAVRISSTLGGAVVREMRTALLARLGQAESDTQTEQLLRSLLSSEAAGSPTGQRLRLLLAAQLAQLKRNPEAMQVIGEVLANAVPGGPERGEGLLMKARCEDTAGDQAAAIESYRLAIKEYPSNIIALNNLAYLLVTASGENNRPQEAKVYADRLWPLVSGDPSGAIILDTVGWVYFKNNDLESAAAALEESLSLDDESNPAAHLHLGEVYTALNRSTEAKKVLEQGLALVRQTTDEEVRLLQPRFEDALGKVH